MALDRELVGRSYPPSAVFEVGRGKLAEFATAIGDPSPLYRDAEAARAAGHPDVPLVLMTSLPPGDPLRARAPVPVLTKPVTAPRLAAALAAPAKEMP